MTEDEFLEQLRGAFVIEAGEHLQTLGAGFLELEGGVPEARQEEIIETIFREVHSLKGAGRAVDRTDIEAVCQALESVFAAWKKRPPALSIDVFDTLNAAVDFLSELRVKKAEDLAAHHARLKPMVARIGGLLTGAGASAPRPPPAAEPAPAPPEEAAPPPPPPLPPPEPESAPAIPQPAAAPEPERPVMGDTVRVPMGKLDDFLLQAEEMVLLKLAAGQRTGELRSLRTAAHDLHKRWSGARRGLRQLLAAPKTPGSAECRELLLHHEEQLESLERRLFAITKASEQEERSVGSLVDGLLDEAKRLVMLPFARISESFPKLVRDLARDEEKEVELILRGGDVEIDKRVLEEMKAPLVHLVRNAIDHGLETPAVREAHGKSARGTLIVSVTQMEGSKVKLLVADDGAGIDLARVRSTAVKAGLLSAAEAGSLDETASASLIFQSGISTSPILTEVSGRGLGMAIVREKVEKLGGQITIDTKLHAGTGFRMILPLTLATFKGIVVEVGGQTFVVPTASVERVIRMKRSEIRIVENRETVDFGDRVVGLAWLAEVLEMPRPPLRDAGGLLEVLVLGAGEGSAAFVVDNILHEQEVLVKSLRKPLVRVRHFAGATVLSTGLPVLILNVSDVVGAANGMTGVALAGAPETPEKPVLRGVVSDDSVTSRMLIRNILESAGYDVTTAVDGLDALNLLRSRPFDFLVTDVEMPRMDGFELTAKVRAEPGLKELPVVLVTALSSREHQARGIDVGASAYIVKGSFEQSNLLETLQRLI